MPLSFFSRRFLLVLGALVLTFVLSAVAAELLQFFPLPDMELMAREFWEDPPFASGFSQHMQFIALMFQHVWPLWMIPAFGLILVVVLWRTHNEEEVAAYLERIHLVEQALKESREHLESAQGGWNALNRDLDTLFARSSEAWMVAGRNNAIRRANDMALKLAQRANPGLASLENQPISSVLGPSALDKIIAEVQSSKRPWSGEVQLPAMQQWLMAYIFPFGDDLAFLLRDVSHEHHDKSYQQSMEVLLRQVVVASREPIAVLDLELRYLHASPTFAESLGIPASTPIIGQPHPQVLPDFPSRLQTMSQQLTAGQPVGKEDERRMVEGQERVFSWQMTPWHDAAGRISGVIFTVADVTEQVRLRQQVSQAEERENALAYSDALTGLPNRQLFLDRLNVSLAQAYRQLGKVALFFLDLDGFKQVNDQLGHDYGDMLLKQVAERLKTCVRKSDTVARLGGDEFTVILAIRDKRDAEQVAQKILATVHAPYDLNGQQVTHVGTSIGIALYPADGAQAADLIRKADAAMYAAKQAGKNTYRFSGMEIKVAPPAAENTES